jgi:alpha-mannosidase
VKALVAEGKLDLIGGAFVPPDQALTDVDSILDNYMLGNQFLKQEFDLNPRVAWQLDDFGISAGFTRLAEDLGIDMMIYESASPQEKESMAKHKSFA